MGGLNGQALKAGLEELAQYLDVVRQLVEGRKAESLADKVPEQYRKDWEQIVGSSDT